MDSQTSLIHQASMEILSTIGICFHHPEVLELFRVHGFKRDGNIVHFSEDQLMDLVAKAPASFMLYAVNPSHDTLIGDQHMAFAAGYGAPYVVQPSGETRNAGMDDYVAFAKLVQVSDIFSLNGGTLVRPAGLPAGHGLPLMVYATMLHSDKGLIAPNGTANETRILFDMLEVFFDTRELSQKPRVTTIANTLSPLQFDKGVLDTILAYTVRRQPLIITPAVMAGATGPVTMAGTLALSNAEILAGIALTQLIKPGTPVVYGMQSTAADMRTGGFSIGGPERALCISWGARLARAYNLPYRASGTDNDAPMVNAQAGMEAMFTMFVAWQARPNLVIHATGMLCGHAAMSYEKFILDLEALELLAHYHKGLAIDKNTLALDVTREVGIGGEYLTHAHTFRNCRTMMYAPRVSHRGGLNTTGKWSSFNHYLTVEKENLLAKYTAHQYIAQDTVKALRTKLAGENIQVSDYACL